jgi:hypothetical protein
MFIALQWGVSMCLSITPNDDSVVAEIFRAEYAKKFQYGLRDR